jgi:hypothetical protein
MGTAGGGARFGSGKTRRTAAAVTAGRAEILIGSYKRISRPVTFDLVTSSNPQLTMSIACRWTRTADVSFDIHGKPHVTIACTGAGRYGVLTVTKRAFRTN